MTSEIRANTLKNRVGLGTVSFTNTGPVVSGIVTIANSTAEGVTLEDNAGVGNSLKITTPHGYVSIGAGNAAFVHLNTDRGSYYFQKRIIVDEGIIGSYDEDLTLQSPINTNRVTINKTTGAVSILNDLDVDGHTNLDNVSIAGVTTTTGFIESVGTSGRGAKLGGLSVGYDTLYATIQPISGNFLHLNYSAGTHVKIGASSTKVDLDVNGDVYPKNSGNRDLGLSTKKWKDVHATTYYGDGSNLTGITQTTINNNATTKFITGTNNANELDCEANLSYNNSLVTFSNSSLMVDKSANATISVKETTGNKEAQFRANTDGGLLRTLGNYPLIFGTNQTEKLRIHEDGWCMLNTSTLGSSKTAKELIVSYNNTNVSGGDQGRAGITIRSGDNTSSVTQNGYIYFSDGTSGDNESKGGVVYEHSNDAMYFATNNTEKLRITQGGFIGMGYVLPQTKLNVKGTISTGRNVARELGTVINVSSSYSSGRSGSNVINGNKNNEAGGDWLTASNQRTNANLTIDLGTGVSCDRFVIYNQNEYEHSNREVRGFTLEGSNDNSNWTTLLDDECGCSHAHEPNPGFSFRLPEGNVYGVDDSEGVNYRYWRFTMKTFHGSDAHGGIMELELYEQSQTIHETSEICTHSLVAGDISTQRMTGIQMLTSTEALNIHTGEDASDTWEITPRGLITNGSYQDKSTIRHKGGVMAVSSAYNTGDLFIRVDNIYNLPGNAWWVCGLMIMSNEIQGGQGGGHHYVTSLQIMGLSQWSSVSKQDIVGNMTVSMSNYGSNFFELFVNVNDSSRGPCTVICNGGTFDPPRISFH